MKKHLPIIIINFFAIIIALVIQNKALIYPDLEQYIQPGLFLITAISLAFSSTSNDKAMKWLIVSALLLLGMSMYVFFLKDQFKSWFALAISLVMLADVLLIIANRKRNYESHEPSIMRSKPLISGVFMVAGFWLFKELDSSLATKKITVIVFIALSVIMSLVSVERVNQVKKSSGWTMVTGVVLLILNHGLILHSLYNRHNDFVISGTTFVAGLAALLIVIGTIEYEHGMHRS